jgi:hypothetical protein
MRRVTFLLLLALAACGQGNPEGFQSPTATVSPFTADVEILYPQDGSIIYSESLYAAGVVSESAQRFVLELVDADDTIITWTTIDAQPGEWEVELVHGYTGEPSEVIVRAVPDDAPDAGEYDTATILISDSSHRPEGSFGQITMPQDGVEVGGDLVLVAGMASGVPDNTLTVELLAEDGRLIHAESAKLVNPYLIDAVPWQVEIAPGDYIGPASIRAASSAGVLDEVDILVTQAAG